MRPSPFLVGVVALTSYFGLVGNQVKPVDKPISKPTCQSGDNLVATGEVSMAMFGTAIVGGMGLVAAGPKRRRR